ncbi:hypothetical protein ES332_A11G303400v1 [Gossypium tomentosum]|uniref:Uncharacterized protein n=1 Tax=Gossypium tomentosum TaxID=34277 RepID=A0A5D2NKW2_GOSTO|nr:hypothetical protein ES332_A11G303400v1 [Gossypium tomentosum]
MLKFIETFQQTLNRHCVWCLFIGQEVESLALIKETTIWQDLFQIDVSNE